MITEHAICALPDDHPDWRFLLIRVQRRINTNQWVLYQRGQYYAGDGAWSTMISDAVNYDETSAIAQAEVLTR